MSANIRSSRRAGFAQARQVAPMGGLINLDPSEFNAIRINAGWTFANVGSQEEQIAMGILISRDGITLIEGHWLAGHFDVTNPADGEQGNLDTFRNQAVFRRHIAWNPKIVFVPSGTIGVLLDIMTIGIDLLAGHANYDVRLQLVRLRAGGIVEPANVAVFSDQFDTEDIPDLPPPDDFQLNDIGAGAQLSVTGI